MSHSQATPAFATLPPPLSERVARASRSVTPMSFVPPPSAAQTPHATAPTLLTQPLPQRTASRPHPDGGIGATSGTVVVLFRADLRLHDHAALTHALEEGARVVPVYVFDTRHFGTSKNGFQKTGRYRTSFLIDSVRALRAALEARGSGLIVRVGLTERIVPTIARQTRAKRVFVHKEIALDEMRVEQALREALPDAGSALERFWSNTLYDESDLPFPLENMPDVYTDFRVAVHERAEVRTPLPAPERVSALPAGLDQGKIPTLADLGMANSALSTRSGAHVSDTVGGVGMLVGGEDEALTRLRNFVAERSNATAEFDGELSKSSSVHAPDFAICISPWLAIGCLSPRLIFDEMKRTRNMAHKVKLSFTYYELVWRDFFRFITSKYSEKKVKSGASSHARAMAN